jgi:surface protein
MFWVAISFNGDLSNWDVSSVTDMSRMFSSATSFDGDIANWDVSSVTDMSIIFYAATSFNGDLSNWDVSSVTNMHSMFMEATSFNCDLSNWDVSSVTDMFKMFYFAKSFAQVLCGAAWFDSSANKDSIFEGSRGLLSKACLSTTTHTMSTSVITPGPITCSKCVTNKAGKRTCCARGGSWFQKCGGPGDSKFDHTWAKGMEVCKCTMAFGGAGIAAF